MWFRFHDDNWCRLNRGWLDVDRLDWSFRSRTTLRRPRALLSTFADTLVTALTSFTPVWELDHGRSVATATSFLGTTLQRNIDVAIVLISCNEFHSAFRAVIH